MSNTVRFPSQSHTPTARPSGVAKRDALLDCVNDALRQVRRSAQGITIKEAQLIKDIGKGRYISGILQAIELGEKCQDLADATALPEAFRGWAVQHHPSTQATVIDAFRAETDANGTANLAQFEFEINPTEPNRQRAIEALNRQLVETHRALVALHQDRRGRMRA